MSAYATLAARFSRPTRTASRVDLLRARLFFSFNDAEIQAIRTRQRALNQLGAGLPGDRYRMLQVNDHGVFCMWQVKMLTEIFTLLAHVPVSYDYFLHVY